jgi:uncharacterized iron-regulated protein
MTRTAIAAALSLCLWLPGTAPPHAAEGAELRRHPGEILDLNTMETLSPGDLYVALEHKKIILIGEQHDNPEHHAVETLLLEELVTPGTAVVFEMLGPGLPLEKLGISTSRSELAAALKPVTQRWDWNSYGPLFHLVLQLGGSLASGNLGQDQIDALYQGEDAGLPVQETQSRAAVTGQVREHIGNEISAQHCEPVPAERLDPMVEIQLARDARMASQLEQHAGDRPALLLAGSYHVRKDLGVPRHLDRDDSAVVMLAMVTDRGEIVGGDELLSNQVADYLWFTSATEETDYCGDTGAGTSHALPMSN